jgi:nucleotide-binding universal stress UspA family protein
MNVNRILAYVDLTDVSEQALEVAVRIAAAFESRLHVLRVIEEPLSAGWTAELSASALPEVQDAMEVETREYLGRVLAAAHAEIEPELDIETGEPAAEILELAADRAIDLVVLGSGGAEGDEDQVVESVVRRARCSVLVVRVPKNL